jgi:hypothetical protein
MYADRYHCGCQIKLILLSSYADKTKKYDYQLCMPYLMQKDDVSSKLESHGSYPEIANEVRSSSSGSKPSLGIPRAKCVTYVTQTTCTPMPQVTGKCFFESRLGD